MGSLSLPKGQSKYSYGNDNALGKVRATGVGGYVGDGIGDSVNAVVGDGVGGYFGDRAGDSVGVDVGDGVG